MKYLAAYALCSLKGDSPTENDIIKVLEAAGTEIDTDRVKHVISELSGKDLQALMSKGSEKLQSFAVGGGAASSGASGTAGSSAGASQAAATEAAPEEEEDEDMGLGLFD